jgi:hypothetical protein
MPFGRGEKENKLERINVLEGAIKAHEQRLVFLEGHIKDLHERMKVRGGVSMVSSDATGESALQIQLREALSKRKTGGGKKRSNKKRSNKKRSNKKRSNRRR